MLSNAFAINQIDQTTSESRNKLKWLVKVNCTKLVAQKKLTSISHIDLLGQSVTLRNTCTTCLLS